MLGYKKRQIIIRFQYEKYYNRYDQDTMSSKIRGTFPTQRAHEEPAELTVDKLNS